MKVFYFYLWLCKRDGIWVPTYVGKGTGSRVFQHLKGCDSHLESTLAQHPSRVVVRPVRTETRALIAERRLIRYFGRADLGKGPLLNKTDGGVGFSGYVRGDEYSRAMSAAKKGTPSWCKGKKLTTEQLASRRTGKPRAKYSDEYRQRMGEVTGRPCTVDGITLYQSRTALIRALGQGRKGSRNPSFRYVTAITGSRKEPFPLS